MYFAANASSGDGRVDNEASAAERHDNDDTHDL